MDNQLGLCDFPIYQQVPQVHGTVFDNHDNQQNLLPPSNGQVCLSSGPALQRPSDYQQNQQHVAHEQVDDCYSTRSSLPLSWGTGRGASGRTASQFLDQMVEFHEINQPITSRVKHNQAIDPTLQLASASQENSSLQLPARSHNVSFLDSTQNKNQAAACGGSVVKHNQAVTPIMQQASVASLADCFRGYASTTPTQPASQENNIQSQALSYNASLFNSTKKKHQAAACGGSIMEHNPAIAPTLQLASVAPLTNSFGDYSITPPEQLVSQENNIFRLEDVSCNASLLASTQNKNQAAIGGGSTMKHNQAFLPTLQRSSVAPLINNFGRCANTTLEQPASQEHNIAQSQARSRNASFFGGANNKNEAALGGGLVMEHNQAIAPTLQLASVTPLTNNFSGNENTTLELLGDKRKSDDDINREKKRECQKRSRDRKKQEAAEMKEKLEKATKENDNLRRSLAAHEETIEIKEKEINELKRNNSKLEETIEIKEKEINEQKRNNSKLEVDYGKLQEKAEDSKKKIKKLKGQNLELKDKLQRIQTDKIGKNNELSTSWTKFSLENRVLKIMGKGNSCYVKLINDDDMNSG